MGQERPNVKVQFIAAAVALLYSGVANEHLVYLYTRHCLSGILKFHSFIANHAAGICALEPAVRGELYASSVYGG